MPGHAADRAEEREWTPTRTLAEQGREIVDLTERLGLEQSRARLWRYPPGAHGRRHAEHVQEEVFVVLDGTLTLLLGDPPERLDLTRGGVARVSPGTPLQVWNQGADELVLLVYGAPPVAGRADMLEDAQPG